MNTSTPAFLRESMRIDGRRHDGDGRVIEVFNPYSGKCVGTVPKASVEDVRRALAVAQAYRPTLSRADRAGILERAAAIVDARRREISELITLESGLCRKDSLYRRAACATCCASPRRARCRTTARSFPAT